MYKRILFVLILFLIKFKSQQTLIESELSSAEKEALLDMCAHPW